MRRTTGCGELNSGAFFRGFLGGIFRAFFAGELSARAAISASRCCISVQLSGPVVYTPGLNGGRRRRHDECDELSYSGSTGRYP